MFDALSIFHLKVRQLAFQVLPLLRSLQLSLGIQLSGGQQYFWKYHQSTQQQCFPSATVLLCLKRCSFSAEDCQCKNKGVGYEVQKGWQDDYIQYSLTSPGKCLSVCQETELFICFLIYFFQMAQSCHFTALWICAFVAFCKRSELHHHASSVVFKHERNRKYGSLVKKTKLRYKPNLQESLIILISPAALVHCHHRRTGRPAKPWSPPFVSSVLR